MKTSTPVLGCAYAFHLLSPCAAKLVTQQPWAAILKGFLAADTGEPEGCA